METDTRKVGPTQSIEQYFVDRLNGCGMVAGGGEGRSRIGCLEFGMKEVGRRIAGYWMVGPR